MNDANIFGYCSIYHAVLAEMSLGDISDKLTADEGCDVIFAVRKLLKENSPVKTATELSRESGTNIRLTMANTLTRLAKNLVE